MPARSVQLSTDGQPRLDSVCVPVSATGQSMALLLGLALVLLLALLLVMVRGLVLSW
jgi:hypothetical protein